MEPTPLLFTRDVLAAREWFRSDYEDVAQALVDILPPFKTVFDVGCAQGFLLAPLHRLGFDVKGIDLAPGIGDLVPASLDVSVGDFSEATGTYDLVCCVEVAEHILPERSDELIDVIARLAGGWVYFSAARPEEDHGYGHINCQRQEQWTQRFFDRGFMLSVTRTKGFRSRLAQLENATWLAPNALLFKRKRL